jgi:hypothetical protein
MKTCFQISTSCSHNHFEEMKTFEGVFLVFLLKLNVRNFSYFLIGYLATSKIIKHAIIAGKIENRHHII